MAFQVLKCFQCCWIFLTTQVPTQTIVDSFPGENWPRIPLFLFLSFNQFIIHEKIIKFLLACDCYDSLRGFEKHCEISSGNLRALYHLTSCVYINWLLWRLISSLLPSIKSRVYHFILFSSRWSNGENTFPMRTGWERWNWRREGLGETW